MSKPEEENTKPDEKLDEELEIEFGEKTLLEIDEAGRTFRKVLMDENPQSEAIEDDDFLDKDKK